MGYSLLLEECSKLIEKAYNIVTMVGGDGEVRDQAAEGLQLLITGLRNNWETI